MSSVFFFLKTFFSEKKMIVFFIFLSLSINGFAPSVSEVRRHSFIMYAATMTHDIALHMIKKCDFSLSELASSIYLCFFESLGKHTQTCNKHEVGNDTVPLQESATGNGIKLAILNNKIELNKDENLPLYANISFTYKSDILYFGQSYDLIFYMPILLFLLFIAVMVRRKYIEENMKSVINKKYCFNKLSI